MKLIKNPEMLTGLKSFSNEQQLINTKKIFQSILIL